LLAFAFVAGLFAVIHADQRSSQQADRELGLAGNPLEP
jgi:hypothetical protein